MNKYILKFFLISFCFLILNGCSNINNIFKSEKTFYRSEAEIIQITEIDKGAKPNQHPINLSEDRIEGALHLVLLKKGNSTVPLFNEKKIITLAKKLSKALKKAKPDEDIIFSMEDWFNNDEIRNTLNFSQNFITSGRVFFSKNKLNLIFGSIMRKGRMSPDPMIKKINEDHSSNPYIPGSRNSSVKNSWGLAAPPNAGVFRPLEAKNRRDWLVFSIKALQPRGETTQKERISAGKAGIEVQGLRAEVQQLRNELRQMSNQYSPNYQYPQNFKYPPNYQNPNNYQYPPNYQYQRNYQYPQSYSYPNNYDQYGNFSKNSYTSEIKNLKILRKRGLISEEDYQKRLRNLKY